MVFQGEIDIKKEMQGPKGKHENGWAVPWLQLQHVVLDVVPSSVVRMLRWTRKGGQLVSARVGIYRVVARKFLLSLSYWDKVFTRE